MATVLEAARGWERGKWVQAGGFLLVLVAGFLRFSSFLLIVSPSEYINNLATEKLEVMLLSVGVLLYLVGYVVTETPVEEPQEEEPELPSTELEPYSVSVEFLVSRIDALEDVQNNLRTGASILAGVFSGIAIWMMNLGRPLVPFEGGVTLACILAALLCLWAIISSFKLCRIRFPAATLNEDLLPENQSEGVYKKQLCEMVKEKFRVVEGIKKTVASAVFWVILVTGAVFDWSGILAHPATSLWVDHLAYVAAFAMAAAVLLFALVVLERIYVG